MNTFPVDFTPSNVLNEKRIRRERQLREKIEEEKSIIRAKVVEEVTRGCEKKWWWPITLEREKRWEKTTFEELIGEIRQKGWIVGYFPEHLTLIICAREPSEEEIETFFFKQ